MTTRPPDRIPEAEVPGILARAAELDRDARETVDLAAIRAAALEAGISPAAVDAALAEYAEEAVSTGATPNPAEEPAPPRWRQWLGKLASPLVHGAAALAAGSFIGAAAPGNEVFLVGGFLAFFLAAWRLLRRHRPSRAVWPYQLTVALMTFGGALGLSGAGADEDVTALLFVAGVTLFVVGSLAIKVRIRWRRSGPVAQLPDRAS